MGSPAWLGHRQPRGPPRGRRGRRALRGSVGTPAEGGLDFGGRRGPSRAGGAGRRGVRGAAPEDRPISPAASLAVPRPVDGPLRAPQPRPGGRPTEERPSDRRGPGRNPGPQGAFEVSMINVSCNSH